MLLIRNGTKNSSCLGPEFFLIKFPQPEMEGFFEAALKGDQSIARPLVMNGVDLEIKDEIGAMVLDHSVRRGDTSMATFLIKNGPNVNNALVGYTA